MNKKTIVLATHNEHKVNEINQLLADTNYEVISLHRLNFNDEIIENGLTYEENAMIKVRAIRKITNLPIIADDSGLEIESLPHLLGIHSARFMEKSTYEERNRALIKLLEHTPNRSAKFVCVIALSLAYDEIKTFRGETFGVIINELRGDNGFGYDPIFFNHELGKTQSEANQDEKNLTSHRGKAVRQLLQYLADTNY